MGFGPLFLRQVELGWSWFRGSSHQTDLLPKDKPPYWPAVSRGRERAPRKGDGGILLKGVTACPRTVVRRGGVIWREEAEMKTLLFG